MWIDAICINQQDLLEKSRQVAMMGEIYANADTMFAWLGPGDATNDAAVNSLEVLTAECHHWTCEGRTLDELEIVDDKMSLPFYRSPWPEAFDSDAFSALLEIKWFSRLWVLQEVVMSRSVILGMGHHTITWEHILREPYGGREFAVCLLQRWRPL